MTGYLVSKRVERRTTDMLLLRGRWRMTAATTQSDYKPDQVCVMTVGTDPGNLMGAQSITG